MERLQAWGAQLVAVFSDTVESLVTYLPVVLTAVAVFLIVDLAYLAANGAKLDVADREGRTPLNWAEGVFLATHPPVRKPETIALLERLQKQP